MINKERITCCCKTHIQFHYYYGVFRSIRGTMHSKEMLQECGIKIPPQTTKYFMSDLFYKPPNDQYLCMSF